LAKSPNYEAPRYAAFPLYPLDRAGPKALKEINTFPAGNRSKTVSHLPVHYKRQLKTIQLHEAVAYVFTFGFNGVENILACATAPRNTAK
jgi:hypothetical protein